MSRILAGGFAVALAGWLVAQSGHDRAQAIPLRLKLVSTEPARMADASGTELRLAIIGVANINPSNRLGRCRNAVFVKDGGRFSEAKLRDHWQTVQGSVLGPKSPAQLNPGSQWEGELLVAAGTESCRVWLQYAAAVDKSYTVKGVVESLATRLPQSLRMRMPPAFWRWVGFPACAPGRRWRTVVLELPLPPVAGSESDASHGQAFDSGAVAASGVESVRGRRVMR